MPCGEGNGNAEHGGRGKAETRRGTPACGEPALYGRRLENLIADEGDALRDLLLTQGKEGRPGQVQALHFHAAAIARFHMGFHLEPLRGRQLLEEVIPKVEWRTTHDIPRALTGASSVLRSSSAVYRRDLTVDTGQERISAISSNLNP